MEAVKGLTSRDLQHAIREVIDEVLEERRHEIVKRAQLKLKKRAKARKPSVESKP